MPHVPGTFLDAPVTSELPAEAREAWASSVTSSVSRAYLEQARSLLDTVKKDEQARLRLSIKPAGAAGAASSATVSDAHKINVQLCLDVHAFAAQLRLVGVNPHASASYAELAEAVRPEERPLDGLVATAAPVAAAEVRAAEAAAGGVAEAAAEAAAPAEAAAAGTEAASNSTSPPTVQSAALQGAPADE